MLTYLLWVPTGAGTVGTTLGTDEGTGTGTEGLAVGTGAGNVGMGCITVSTGCTVRTGDGAGCIPLVAVAVSVGLPASPLVGVGLGAAWMPLVAVAVTLGGAVVSAGGVLVASPPPGFGLGPVGLEMAARSHTNAPTITTAITPSAVFLLVLIVFLLPPMLCYNPLVSNYPLYLRADDFVLAMFALFAIIGLAVCAAGVVEIIRRRRKR